MRQSESTAATLRARMGWRRLVRLLVVAAALARGLVGWVLACLRGQDGPGAAAVQVRIAFERLGPTYIKLGQLIASSPGLFPQVLADELRRCLDEVPPMHTEAMRCVVADELGDDVEICFGWLAPRPLASASIAQVHAAALPDGSPVVVKIQRPGLVARMRADLGILHQLARVLERISVRARMANPIGVVDDLAATLAAELDFEREARSMERFAALLPPSAHGRVRVPEVQWSHTGRRVLTMQRMHGTSIDDVATLRSQDLDLPEILRQGVAAWLYTALVEGFFHGDVHAGNLLVDDAGALVFLDFGICGELQPDVRDILRSGLPALLLARDFEAVARAIHELGAVPDTPDLQQAADDIAEIVGPLLDRPLAEISYGQVLVDVIRIGARYQLRLPQSLVLVAKQLLYFERYAKLMAPDWNILGDAELLAILMPPGGSDLASA